MVVEMEDGGMGSLKFEGMIAGLRTQKTSINDVLIWKITIDVIPNCNVRTTCKND
jgi:hypothetical protein